MKITPDKILFFDLDGTLIDTDYANWLAYKKAYEISEIKKNKDIDPILFEYNIDKRFYKSRLEYLLWIVLDEMRIPKKIYERYCDEIILKKKEFYSENLKFTKQIEENVDILKRFSKTNKIILVSNCSRERGIETLKYHQLDTFFHKMFFAEDKTLSENKYENAIQLLGISSDNIIAFEDDKNEIERAKEVGIMNINISIDGKNIREFFGGIFRFYNNKVLIYQDNDSKMRVEIEDDVLRKILDKKEDCEIYLDKNIHYFPKKEGDSKPPQGVNYKILIDGLKEFIIESNDFLEKDIHSFYHKDYISGGGNWGIEGKIEHLIWALKNDEGCRHSHKRYLSTAYKRLKNILHKDLPKIKEKIGVEKLAVCVVPRAKEGFVYKEDQLLFRKAVSDVVEELNFINGTKYLVRHTSTKTTHLRNGEGLSPYPGITKDTCYISDRVIGKDILLVDDVYTKSININEDAIQALLDKGANSVYFYSIGKTHSLIK